MRVPLLWIFIVVIPVLYGCGKPNTQVPQAVDNTPAYLIKVKYYPDVGKSMVIRDVQTVIDKNRILDSSGKLLREQNEPMVIEGIVTMTVLEKGDTNPKKYKLFTEKISVRRGDQVMPIPPGQGRTVIYELKDGKYELSVEGQPPLPAETLKMMDEHAQTQLKLNDTLRWPTKPVREGDTWPLDAEKLAGGFVPARITLHPTQSQGEGKLIKVYQKEGMQFGTIEFTVKLAGNNLMGANPMARGTTVVRPETIEFKMTVDAVIDGTSTAGTRNVTVTTRGEYRMENQNDKQTFEMDIEATNRSERSQEKP